MASSAKERCEILPRTKGKGGCAGFGWSQSRSSTSQGDSKRTLILVLSLQDLSPCDVRDHLHCGELGGPEMSGRSGLFVPISRTKCPIPSGPSEKSGGEMSQSDRTFEMSRLR